MSALPSKVARKRCRARSSGESEYQVNVLYVFYDAGVPGAAKVGLNTNSSSYPWPFRYQQARSHSPREIHVAAAWDLGTKDRLKRAESQAKALLKPCRRTTSGGIEWFDLPADEIVARLSRELALPQPFLRNRDPAVPLYDDWRNDKDIYKGEVWRRYLWVHGEDGPDRRLKVIHSSDYDTQFIYAFTYNPHRVHLVAGYEPASPAPRSPDLMSRSNDETGMVWARLMRDSRLADRPNAPQVGWLKPGTTLSDIDAFVASHGLVRFDLRRPKPRCAKPRTSQINPPIAHGEAPPMRRIADWS